MTIARSPHIYASAEANWLEFSTGNSDSAFSHRLSREWTSLNRGSGAGIILSLKKQNVVAEV